MTDFTCYIFLIGKSKFKLSSALEFISDIGFHNEPLIFGNRGEALQST